MNRTLVPAKTARVAMLGGISEMTLHRWLNDPALNERMTATGQIVNPGSPAEFAAAIDEQSKNLAAWSKAIGGRLK